MTRSLEGCVVKKSVMGNRWLLTESNDIATLHLSQRFELPEIIARILNLRGIHIDQAENFLNPTLKAYLADPSHLKDMDKAVDRLVKAIQKNEIVAIYGDYDVDGATSSALLLNFLNGLGVKTLYYIPDRLKEGYGPNIVAFKNLQEKGARVIVTVDCGTTSFEVLEEASHLDVDVIIIDHHAGEPKLPKAYAVVNPNRMDESSPLGHMAAVGVAFLLAVALNRSLREKGHYKDMQEPDLLQFLDLVALGTVCDVVPLRDLNRAFVTQGLKVLSKRTNLGIRILSDLVGIDETPEAYHLGFMIGPRINAGGRVGQSDLGVRLLTTQDLSEAQEIAKKLDYFNRERQEIEQTVLEEAFQQAQHQGNSSVLIVSGIWHPGVIGIVAGRLKERYYKPTLVISLNEQGIGKGSGRSIDGIDLGALVHAAKQKDLLLEGGGHAMAAGFSIEESQIPALRDFFNDRLKDLREHLVPILKCDGRLAPQALTIELAETLERLGPFGQGNPTPRFVISDLWISKIDIMAGKHLSCIFRDLAGNYLRAVAFRAVDTPLEAALKMSRDQSFQIIGTIKVNRWGGRVQPQFQLIDIALVNENTQELAEAV
ncbi:single-stranded-DNA-specific exonuclease RecJ [Candidatus Nucleicultrix amoebiphila]|uniref:single-stranded-DNA-specific exonuclease RecJ n=1 Tax=Candidatus Nucleicultrix amoebiphila TaxID=1509244 RepID=UPI000A269B10|nr:single-stranded-DNA-specific exonuclease RecJ [Candidatus Nucleicultrix amoebiphila]